MLVLMVGVSLELWLTRRLAGLARGRSRSVRAWQGVGMSLWRGVVMMAAVLVTYPALFGFRAAPPLATLVPGEAARGAALLGLVVLGRVLAPLLPALRKRPGMLDAVQGMGVAAVLFTSYADYLGALSVSVWPGLLAAVALAALSALLPALAAGLGRDFGAGLDARRGSSGLAPLFGETMGMAAVAPIVMLYGYLLGMQLAL